MRRHIGFTLSIRQLFLATVVVFAILSGCTSPSEPTETDWCFVFDFAEPLDPNVGIAYGFWIAGSGIRTDDAGRLNINYTHGSIVQPAGVTIGAGRASGVVGDINVRGAGNIFGITPPDPPGEIQQSIPAIVNDGQFVLLPQGSTDSGNSFNFTIQASAPIILQDLTVRGYGASPFGMNNCGEEPPTVVPGPTTILSTDTPTNTAQPTSTPSMTPSWSPTPSPTATATATYCPPSPNYVDGDTIFTNTFEDDCPVGLTTQNSNSSVITGTGYSGTKFLRALQNGVNNDDYGSTRFYLLPSNVWLISVRYRMSGATAGWVRGNFGNSDGTSWQEQDQQFVVNTGTWTERLFYPNAEAGFPNVGVVLIDFACQPATCTIEIDNAAFAINGIATSTPTNTYTPSQTYTPSTITPFPSPGPGTPTRTPIGIIDPPALTATAQCDSSIYEPLILDFNQPYYSNYAHPSGTTLYDTSYWSAVDGYHSSNDRVPDELSNAWRLGIRFRLPRDIDISQIVSMPVFPSNRFASGQVAFYDADNNAIGVETVTTGISQRPVNYSGVAYIAIVLDSTIGQFYVQHMTLMVRSTNCGTPLPASSTPVPIPSRTAVSAPTFVPTPAPEDDNFEDQGEINILNAIGEFFSWIRNSASNFGDWLDSLVKWGQGTTANAVTLAGNILNGIGAALNFAFSFFGDLLATLRLIVDIVGHLLAILGDYIGQFASRAQSIITAWMTAVPTPIPFLPHCVTDQLNYEICAVWYIFRYTVFDGELGSLIIPTANAVLGLMIVLMFILKARNLLKRGSEVTE